MLPNLADVGLSSTSSKVIAIARIAHVSACLRRIAPSVALTLLTALSAAQPLAAKSSNAATAASATAKLPTKSSKPGPTNPERSKAPSSSDDAAGEAPDISKSSSKSAAAQAAPAKRAPSKQEPSKQDLAKLGPLSVGHPHAGYLVNAVKMPSSPEWVLTVPSHGYGTQETVDALGLCIRAVHAQFPESERVMLGSLSAQRGGLLPPHKSHRTGRDADVYFFRKPGARWVKAATEDDIDLPRTWAMLRCFVTDTDVEMILIDRKVQGWLEEYARSIDEPAEWIDELFHDQKGAKSAIVRHVPGHVAHMHVRFISAKARRAAVKVYDKLVATGLVPPGVAQITHEVVKGDTLSQLAERHHCSVATIQKLNDLSSTVIKIGQRLTLQKAVDVRGAREAVYQPARRLPPALVTPQRSAQPASNDASSHQPSANQHKDDKGKGDKSSGAQPSAHLLPDNDASRRLARR